MRVSIDEDGWRSENWSAVVQMGCHRCGKAIIIDVYLHHYSN